MKQVVKTTNGERFVSRLEEATKFVAISDKFVKLPLKAIAKMETLNVLVNGKEVKPYGFSETGEPIFTTEQYQLIYMNDAMNFRKESEMKVLVQYERDIASGISNQKEYDEYEWLQKKVEEKGIQGILEIMSLRRKAALAGKILKTWVIFGRYLLGVDGSIRAIKFEKEVPYEEKAISLLKDSQIKYGQRVKVQQQYVFPYKTGMRCPICGGEFTCQDIRKNWLVKMNNGLVHEKCQKAFEYQTKRYQIFQIMDTIYPEKLEHESEDNWEIFNVPNKGYIYIAVLKNQSLYSTLIKIEFWKKEWLYNLREYGLVSTHFKGIYLGKFDYGNIFSAISTIRNLSEAE